MSDMLNFVLSNLQGLPLIHYIFHMQILKNIEDIKRSMIERDAAVKDLEDGASDMKMKAEDLTKKLDENEKEYQV